MRTESPELPRSNIKMHVPQRHTYADKIYMKARPRTKTKRPKTKERKKKKNKYNQHKDL
jgi:hypothetical protein